MNSIEDFERIVTSEEEGGHLNFRQGVYLFIYVTIATMIMAVGVYFFKFPNNFVFGGITGMAPLAAKLTPLSASSFTFIANFILLIIGFLFLGKRFAIMTGYSSTLLSVLLVVFEKVYPLSAPLSNQPTLELIFAIALPALASAMLFHAGASSGGTDVIAKLIQKYAHVEDIGLGLFLSDFLMIIFACFVFSIQTALYSFVGLVLKSFVIDGVIRNMNLRKATMIVCEDPKEITDFIIRHLDRGATILEGTGAYTGNRKYIIFTTLDRFQEQKTREFIHRKNLHAFITVYQTSEVFGKGFLKL